MPTLFDNKIYLNSLTDAERVAKCKRAHYAICTVCFEQILPDELSLDRGVDLHKKRFCKAGKIAYYRYVLPA